MSETTQRSPADPPVKTVSRGARAERPPVPGVRLRREIGPGLLHVHDRLQSNRSEIRQALSTATALVQLLARSGLVDPRDLEESKLAVKRTLEQDAADKGLSGVLESAPVGDKYDFQHTVEIDCASRLHLCRASCCRLKFSLSRQDVDEGIVRWDLESPYAIARDTDGHCSSLERGALGCSVWKNRPATYRAYDCRQDKRIWLDFEKR